jgi:hypothetical protein
MFLAWAAGRRGVAGRRPVLCRTQHRLRACGRRLSLPAPRLRPRGRLPVRLGPLCRDHHRFHRPARLRVRRLPGPGGAAAGLCRQPGGALYAGAAVLALGLLNLHGLRRQRGPDLADPGSRSAACCWWPWRPCCYRRQRARRRSARGAALPGKGSFGLAMVFVLLTYGGWNEAAYLSAEVRDGATNMVRSLVLAVLIVTGLYLLVTWAYWRGLGMPRWRHRGAGRRADAARLRPRRRAGDRAAGGGVRAHLDQRHHDRRRPHRLRDGARLAAAGLAGALGRPARHPGRGHAAAMRRRPAAGRPGHGPGRRLPRHGRVHGAGVLAVLPAERHLAVRAAPARTRAAPRPLPGAAVSAAAAAVLRQLRLHAVVQPELCVQPVAGRPERRLDRRRGAGRRPAAARPPAPGTKPSTTRQRRGERR